MKRWFIKHQKEELGPYSIEELSLLLSENDEVWTFGLPGWVKASLVPELEILFVRKGIPTKKTERASVILKICTFFERILAKTGIIFHLK